MAARSRSRSRRRRHQLPQRLRLRSETAEYASFALGVGTGTAVSALVISRAMGVSPKQLCRMCHWELYDLLNVRPEDAEISPL